MINIDVLKLTSPIPPSVNHFLKPRAFIKNGRAVVTMYEEADVKKYRKYLTDLVKKEVIKQGIVWIPNKTQHFYVDCVFYFERIDQDPSNYFKCLLDAITDSGCVWDDDNVALERVERIYYDSNNPRIELKIFPVDYIGIFDNKEVLDKFENKCKQCSKYKDGKCGIFNRAKKGRVQDDIDEFECLKFKEKKVE